MKKGIIIAIDGPAGAGKSTIGRLLARELGFIYVDTGAIYRAIAWKSRNRGIDWENAGEVSEIAETTSIDFQSCNGENRIICDGKDISDEIRSSEMGQGASKISAIPEVRRALLRIQRELGASGRIVMDGRDIGTVIFPEADIKFYLTASLTERGRRRRRELAGRGEEKELTLIQEELEMRDKQDSSRKVAPLTRAFDAIEIDTSELRIEEVLHLVLKEIKKRLRS